MPLLGGIWPQINLTKEVTHWATRCLCLGEGQVYILCNSQSVSQPTSHVKKCQPVRLWVGQIVDGGRTGGLTTLGPSPGSQHSHWFPLGEWPTSPRPGRWHKWALQPFIYHWYYLQWPFAVLYLHNLITYSCTKYREMLLRLFSVQTNLLISFHHQSGVLLHKGTTFWELLLSSDIGNAMGKKLLVV